LALPDGSSKKTIGAFILRSRKQNSRVAGITFSNTTISPQQKRQKGTINLLRNKEWQGKV